jgi:hypothetical protein
MQDNPDNIVDFTIVKLKKLKQEYLEQGMYETAAIIDYALDLYKKDKASIQWIGGNPHLKDMKEDW